MSDGMHVEFELTFKAYVYVLHCYVLVSQIECVLLAWKIT